MSTVIRSISSSDLFKRIEENYPDEHEKVKEPLYDLANRLVSYVVIDDSIDNEESRRGIMVVVNDTTNEQILEIAEMIGIDPEGKRCNHEHDCCGCWYSSRLKIEDLLSGNFRYATISFYRNV